MAATHRVVMDTLRVRLGLIRGLTLFSRHHLPSLSIIDEFNYGCVWVKTLIDILAPFSPSSSQNFDMFVLKITVLTSMLIPLCSERGESRFA